MNDSHSMPGHAGLPTIPMKPVSKAPSRPRKGLYVRFVTRMSGDLSAAVAEAARRDGLSAGAWVRRLLLDRVGMQSPQDAKSNRPIRRPDADQAEIAAAVRALAGLSAALSVHDEAAARERLQEARAHLIPLAVRRPPT
ncbi:hypothetical protein [Methylorubrum thiocyanatum]|uniref:hypothetical protein n=1 Tax=Methylorubrum thiocyanatum TaxID=47958 RepID=UPI00398C4515